MILILYVKFATELAVAKRPAWEPNFCLVKTREKLLPTSVEGHIDANALCCQSCKSPNDLKYLQKATSFDHDDDQGSGMSAATGCIRSLCKLSQ